MDKKEMEKLWNEMLADTFDAFIKKTVGYDTKDEKPSCFGTGGGDPWCTACALRPVC